MAHYGRPPEELGEAEIRQFLLHLIEVEEVSYPTYRQILAAVKFLYTVTLSRPWEFERIPFPRHRQYLQRDVLTSEQLVRLFATFRRPQFRTFFMTSYAAGLRISETCQLRVDDIESHRMVIRIRHGKGAKPRYTVLSKQLLVILREHWKLERPTHWLFPGPDKAQPVQPESMRHVFRRARQDAGLGPNCTPHSLRHSFATHLLESGTQLVVIQQLLGHATIKTTSNYTHVRTDHIRRITSPFDLLPASVHRAP